MYKNLAAMAVACLPALHESPSDYPLRALAARAAS